MSGPPKKRKQTSDATPAAKRPRFAPKPGHHIPTPSTRVAYPDGELNVAHFMRAHESEIRALENAMRVAKKGLARRAFQDVPRDLRRRTGSHNPQRVPKRLRAKARKEALEDNTPISKNKSGSGIGKGAKKWLREQGIDQRKRNRAKRKEKELNKVSVTAIADGGNKAGLQQRAGSKIASGSRIVHNERSTSAALAKPLMPPSRFRRRQIHKTWLPTHVWHAKRATMTPPKQPLWRFALPLAPITKSYRLTHRAISNRGAAAWDVSYMATIGLEGIEQSIRGVLTGLHFAQEDDRLWQEQGLGRKWRNGTRIWEGWIYEREGLSPNRIAQVTIIWAAQSNADAKKRKLFVRVHPSAFFRLWNEIVRIAKAQKPAVTVEDLRFEIGSIDIMGPAALETLIAVLQPSSSADVTANSPASVWSSLACVTDAGLMPTNSLFAFSISDPRLRDPLSGLQYSDDITPTLTETLAFWPVDNTQKSSAIFERNSRLVAGRSLPSQQSINRRKRAAIPGHHPKARSTDPQIPILVFSSTESKSWTVLMPWKCVLPIWRCMMRYAISTGGNPRLGGLKERRQVDYERSKPFFPYDYPATDAGWDWEVLQRIERKNEWVKRPKGKRIEWTTLDLGHDKKGEIGEPWACAWERLAPKAAQAARQSSTEPETTRPPLRQASSATVSELMTGRSLSTLDDSKPQLFTAKISMVQRGLLTECARVYRLPFANSTLREQWLRLLPGQTAHGAQRRPSTDRAKLNLNTKERAPKHLRTKALAASLLNPISRDCGQPKVGTAEYPALPDEEDLIGFVTTGNFNLAEGLPTAIANLAVQRTLGISGGSTLGGHKWRGRQVCIVREAGQTFGRLATWEVV